MMHLVQSPGALDSISANAGVSTPYCNCRLGRKTLKQVKAHNKKHYSTFTQTGHMNTSLQTRQSLYSASFSGLSRVLRVKKTLGKHFFVYGQGFTAQIQVLSDLNCRSSYKP